MNKSQVRGMQGKLTSRQDDWGKDTKQGKVAGIVSDMTELAQQVRGSLCHLSLDTLGCPRALGQKGVLQTFAALVPLPSTCNSGKVTNGTQLEAGLKESYNFLFIYSLLFMYTGDLTARISV